MRSSRGCTSPASATVRVGSTSAPIPPRSACARHWTCSVACSSTGPARAGARPAVGRALSRLLHQALRGPCVGYVDREDYRRGIDAIVDFLSGRYRDVERDLERKMAEAAADEEFERAAVLRDRLRGGAQPDGTAQRRRRVAGERRRLRSRSRAGGGSGLPVRDGVLAERHGFYRQRGRARRGRGDRGVPRPVLLRRPGSAAARRRRPGAARARAGRRRGPLRAARGPVEVRVAERGTKPSAARPRAAKRRWRWRRTFAPGRRRAQRVDALSALRTSSRSRRCRFESRASTSPTSVASTRSPRWSSSRAARAAEVRCRFRVRGDRSAGPDDFSSLEEVLGRRVAQLLEQADRSRTTPAATRASRRFRT